MSSGIVNLEAIAISEHSTNEDIISFLISSIGNGINSYYTIGCLFYTDL